MANDLSGRSDDSIAKEIVASLPIPCALFGSDGELIAFSESLRAMLGFDPMPHTLRSTIERLGAGGKDPGDHAAQVRRLENGACLLTVDPSASLVEVLVDEDSSATLVHVDHKPLYANKAMADYLGYEDLDELMAKRSLVEHLAGNGAQAAPPDSARPSYRPPTDHYAREVTRRNGSRAVVSATTTRARLEPRAADRGVLPVTTAHRRVEDSLQDRIAERDSVIKGIFDHFPAAISLIDDQGRLKLVNRTFEERWGVSRESIVGQPIERLLPDSYAAEVRTQYRSILDSGETFRIEEVAPDGKSFDVVVRAPVMDASGRPNGIISFRLDISNKKQAEAALETSESHLRAVLDYFPASIVVSGSDGYIQIVNRRFEERWGIDLEDARGRHWSSLLPPALAGQMAEQYARVIESGEVYREELYSPQRDRYELAVRGPVRNADGEIKAVVAMRVDITDRRKAEEALRKAMVEAKARSLELQSVQSELVQQERLATLGRLNATVSHELRNPLGTIAASLDVLRRSLRTSDPRILAALGRSERNMARCLRIIDDLLDYARTLDIQRQRISLDPWLADIASEHLGASLVQMKLDLQANQEIAMDPDRMRQVISNLLDNAHQGLDGRPGVVTVASRAARGGVTISVTDTGPGISPELRGQVFEPLFSTKPFGLGLGLPLVRQIVLAHGGSVRIDDHFQDGCRVIVDLPDEQTA